MPRTRRYTRTCNHAHAPADLEDASDEIYQIWTRTYLTIISRRPHGPYKPIDLEQRKKRRRGKISGEGGTAKTILTGGIEGRPIRREREQRTGITPGEEGGEEVEVVEEEEAGVVGEVEVARGITGGFIRGRWKG